MEMKYDNILHTLRRMALIVLLMVAACPCAMAQKGLSVDQVFERLGHERGCKMVTMRNTTLKGYRLAVYKSLVYKHQGAQVAPYLEADRKRARKVREVVEDGHVTGGYYMMAPLAGGLHRYILFSNGSGGRGTVIYIEGALSPDDIMRLCYTRR